MEIKEFIKLKTEFDKGSTSEKIRIYTQTPGLSKKQYSALLKSFPVEDIELLEDSLLNI
jgi:hypothetical protein